MVAWPQRGACLCGAVGYRLDEDPVTVYACHCTDCQRQTGSSFALSMIVRRGALHVERGQSRLCSVELDDGRRREAHVCPRCSTRIWGPARVPELALLEPGTLDDTSWVAPIGHIWTRSAQPWIPIPPDSLTFEGQPGEEEWLDFARAWKGRCG